MVLWTRGVATYPGHMALILIPFGAYGTASAHVKPMTLCFDAVYVTTGAHRDVAIKAYIEATLMITPRSYGEELRGGLDKQTQQSGGREATYFFNFFCRSITLISARLLRVISTFRVLDHSSTLCSADRSMGRPIPAFFTAKSILPNWITVSATAFLMDASLVTSILEVMIYMP